MKMLISWPIPEAIACIVIGSIAGAAVNSWPATILVGAGVGLIIAAIGRHLRDKFDADY